MIDFIQKPKAERITAQKGPNADPIRVCHFSKNSADVTFWNNSNMFI